MTCSPAILEASSEGQDVGDSTPSSSSGVRAPRLVDPVLSSCGLPSLFCLLVTCLEYKAHPKPGVTTLKILNYISEDSFLNGDTLTGPRVRTWVYLLELVTLCHPRSAQGPAVLLGRLTSFTWFLGLGSALQLQKDVTAAVTAMAVGS